jgi:Flp pilus assembly pilin Flp
MRRRDERGAAVVEMAVILPFLLVLVIGVTDVGWLIWKRIELQEALQEGAIYYSFNPTLAGQGEAVKRTREATNIPIKQDDFSSYLPLCQSPNAKTFKIGVKHKLALPFTGSGPTVTVEVSGDVLAPGGCKPS